MAGMQRVLIVDDEPRNQRILAETLDGVVEFRVASSGEQAIQEMKDFLPDLVLLDIMMPGLDGYEVCRRIRADARLTLTKVILVSGKAMVEERLKGYEVGADDYMTKPFVSEELLAKAKVFLRLTLVERELTQLTLNLDQKVQERTEQLFLAEAKLVSTAKMSALGEMAGGIAHEINTPLGTIGMIADQLTEMLKEDGELDREEAAQMTETVAVTVSRIGLIIQGLRTFSRDGSRDRFDQSSVKQIVESTLALCGEKVKSGGIEVSVSSIGDEISIACRPVQISQVLLNLINNACDAISHLDEKWLKISVEEKQDHIELSVTDSGSGVAEAVREKVFQPFFTTKDIGKGTGLGLSVSKGIADAHRGQLFIDSACANTRFVLRLPKDSTSAEPAPKVS
jgi:C4-dicarboxylate-specific signal transduction histidine kinase